MLYEPSFVPDNREFSFEIHFPSIALPVTRKIDSTWNSEKIATVDGFEYDTSWVTEAESAFNKKWTDKIEHCIRQKAKTITDFEVSVLYNLLADAYVFDAKKQWCTGLVNSDNEVLFIKDFMYYKFYAYIMTNKDNAEKLLALDYSNCISEEERRRPQIITKMKELVKQSTKPNLNVDKGEVGLLDYRDEIIKHKIYQQEYSIRWLETDN
ncbi:hypothetical protein [Winogradskyella sp.]|uniref:hypothetical protein n=1 Tax=Winogradskyella sp. TaxID=1883156 RepID=UPI00262D8743|nr:hypothetical protein [Winogradskyella sp.]